jgi:hypothetical protein
VKTLQFSTLFPIVGINVTSLANDSCFSYCGSYSLVLRHTVEEIVDGCVATLQPSTASALLQFREQVRAELNKSGSSGLLSQVDLEVEKPMQLSLSSWIKEAKACGAVVFIAGETLTIAPPCLEYPKKVGLSDFQKFTPL